MYIPFFLFCFSVQFLRVGSHSAADETVMTNGQMSLPGDIAVSWAMGDHVCVGFRPRVAAGAYEPSLTENYSKNSSSNGIFFIFIFKVEIWIQLTEMYASMTHCRLN